jgi:AcrR family transcriptional regulator
MSRKQPHAKTALATSPRPRTKPPGVRREELMNAAERLFLNKGIAATSIDEIVSAADVAKGTFYLHFTSKEQLLDALQQRFVVDSSDRLIAAMNRRRIGDWKGRLRAWVEASVGGYLDRVALHDVVFHEFRPGHRHPKHDNPVADGLAELLEDGTRAGAWSVDDPRFTAILLFEAVHGAVDDLIEAHLEVNRKRLTAKLEAFVHRVVGLG